MKYSEFHKLIKERGWKYVSASGSHYFYEKNGIKSPPIPFHGSKEIGEGLRKRIIKDLELD
ncbi:MAG: type II toxin-antitoxin system HicA family toxin [Bacteroidales bacterium]|jgi:mRNA interferase HicA